jgi:hypothetical protein
MEKNKNISKDTVIFSTGVYLKPQKVEKNGKSQWRWIAIGFEDSSFSNGKGIDVYDYSDEVQGLLIPSE